MVPCAVIGTFGRCTPRHWRLDPCGSAWAKINMLSWRSSPAMQFTRLLMRSVVLAGGSAILVVVVWNDCVLAGQYPPISQQRQSRRTPMDGLRNNYFMILISIIQ